MNFDKAIKKIVILGGGTAGWMSAALLQKVFGKVLNIVLVESKEIGTIGVGEATIPAIKQFNNALGIKEDDFLRETKSTMKLGIQFENWGKLGDCYMHAFGDIGTNLALCPFHHFWLKAGLSGVPNNLWNYSLNYQVAKANKFAHISRDGHLPELVNAYHFDAYLYAKYLQKLSLQMGINRIEGLVEHIKINPESGFVQSLTLTNGVEINGDLFIDCSGFQGLLIQKKLNTGYDEWNHWLPCDRAVTVPSERFSESLPYTRSIAREAGWQWRIPLQHRNGNGFVYNSEYYTEDQAAKVLLSNLETEISGELKVIPFQTGCRRKHWNRNVVAIGLSSGFLEPLESTSIHLIHSAIFRLIKHFPNLVINQSEVEEYNRQSKIEFEHIRDFIILHYYLNQRDDSQFWRDCRNMKIPDLLKHKIKLFSESGKIFSEHENLFTENAWLQVMVGQGIVPLDYHPLAGSVNSDQLKEMLSNLMNLIRSPITNMPSHDQYIAEICGG